MMTIFLKDFIRTAKVARQARQNMSDILAKYADDDHTAEATKAIIEAGKASDIADVEFATHALFLAQTILDVYGDDVRTLEDLAQRIVSSERDGV